MDLMTKYRQPRMLRYPTLLFLLACMLVGGCSFNHDLPTFDTVPNSTSMAPKAERSADEVGKSAKRREEEALKEIEAR